jgi:hypothetical protein
MLLMTIDHIGMIFFPNDILWRIVGRLAFPLFAFLIFEGFIHTRSRLKYFVRLLAFGLLIELGFFIILRFISIDFDLTRNIFLTLSFGLLGLILLNTKQHYLLKILGVGALAAVSQWMKFDYGAYGVLLIVSFYLIRYDIRLVMSTQVILNIIYFVVIPGSIQFFSLFSWFFIAYYNGELGPRLKPKYILYFYYPFHLIVLYLLKMLLFQ